MYETLVRRYQALLIEMLAKRARGALTQEAEFDYAGKLDELWNVLTDDEQAEIERWNGLLK